MAAFVIISTLSVIVPGMAMAHPGGPSPDGDPFPGGFDRDHIEGYPQGPGMRLFVEDRRPLFMFGALNMDFRKGNLTESFELQNREWVHGFDPLVGRFSYMANVTMRIADPEFNRTEVRLDFRPFADENTRRIEYNLTLDQNLTMDSISIRWKLDPMPEEMGRAIPGQFPDWGWSKHPNHLALNDPEGVDMARLHWDGNARGIRGDHVEYLPMESSNTVVNETVILEMNLDIGTQVDSIKTGGYLDFLDEFITILEEGTNDAGEIVRDHILSFALAAIVCTVMAVGVLLYSRKKVSEEPRRDLDYRQSRFYKRP